MKIITIFLRYRLADQRYVESRLRFGAVIMSLAFHCMNVADTAIASETQQTDEATPFNIHPLCLDGLIGALDSSAPDEVEVKANTLVQCQGAEIEVEIQENSALAYTGVESLSKGYAAYTIMGDLSASEGFVFRFEISGGGSGRFTSLWLFEGEATSGENMVRMSRLADGGDRCNGSISNVKIIEGATGDDLIIERVITPYAFMFESDNLPSSFRDIEPYSDLANCAACCAGTMTTRRTISDKGAGSVVGFRILKTSSRSGAGNNQGDLQACFDNLVNEQSKGKKQLMLSAEEADRFREVFANDCVRK